MALPLALPAWPQSAGPKLRIDIYSRHLLWLRRAEEVAAGALEMGFDGLRGVMQQWKTMRDLADGSKWRSQQVISVSSD
jgi:hypothetical protein